MWNLFNCILAAFCQVGLTDIRFDLFNDILIATLWRGFRIKDGLDVPCLWLAFHADVPVWKLFVIWDKRLLKLNIAHKQIVWPKYRFLDVTACVHTVTTWLFRRNFVLSCKSRHFVKASLEFLELFLFSFLSDVSFPYGSWWSMLTFVI
jgi:hypothetical protein